MKTNKNILKNKKNNIEKKKTKKKIKLIQNKNQQGGFRIVEDEYNIDFMIEFSKDNSGYGICDHHYYPKPDIILEILEKFNNIPNVKGKIDFNKEIGIENLKICKKKTSINSTSESSPEILRYYHSYLILYFELDGEKFLLGTFGLTELDNNLISTDPDTSNNFKNPAVITLPDLYSIDSNNSVRGKEQKNVKLKVAEETEDKSVQINNYNLKFIISLLFVLKYSQEHCYYCMHKYQLPERNIIECPNCKKSFDLKSKIDFSNTQKNSLIIYKLCAFTEIKPYNYEYNIIFGKYSIASYRGVNCQTFCNLFINLCKGNPTYFKEGMLHKSTKSVVKRLQMIIYLFEINRILYRKKKENNENEYEPYYLELNNYYGNLISHLKFYEYTFKQESISVFRLPFLKLYSKLISGYLKTNLPEEKDKIQLDKKLEDDNLEEPAEAEFKEVMRVLDFNKLEEEFEL